MELVQKIFADSRLLSGHEWKQLQAAIDHASSRPKVMQALEEHGCVLTQPDKYAQYCEMLKLIAHACRYDMHALLKLYKIAGHSALTLNGVELSAKQTLNNLLVWSNLPFWLDTALHLIEQDRQLVEILHAELSATSKQAPQFMLGMSAAQLRELFVIMRIYAVVAAMRSVKVPRDSVESFLSAAAAQLRIKDISEPRRDLFAFHIESLILLLLSSQGLHMEVNKGVFYRPEVHSQQLSYVSIEALKDASTHEIGRCVFIDIFYGCALMPIRQHRSGQRSAMKKGSSSTNRCVCGTSIQHWKMVGLASAEESLLMRRLYAAGVLQGQACIREGNRWELLPSLLCEACYRDLYNEANGLDAGDSLSVSCCPVFSRAADEGGNKMAQQPVQSPVVPVPLPSPSVAAAVSPRGIKASPHTSRYSTDDDGSVLSGISHMNVLDDDVSVVSRTEQQQSSSSAQTPDLPKLTDAEFTVFLTNLWTGIPITLVYSYEPLIEKTRLLYLCSSDSGVMEIMKTKLSSRSREGLDKAFYKWMATKSSTLHLGWAHMSEQKKLLYNSKKSLPVTEIKNIKVGSARWKNCVKIGSTSVVIVVKVDHDEQFQILLKGLTQLISIMTSSHK